MGKPVVANEEVLEHKKVMDQSNGGILVPFLSEAFACAIIELLDNFDVTQEMGWRGKEWVVKSRTFDILARRLEERYIHLLKHS